MTLKTVQIEVPDGYEFVRLGFTGLLEFAMDCEGNMVSGVHYRPMFQTAVYRKVSRPFGNVEAVREDVVLHSIGRLDSGWFRTRNGGIALVGPVLSSGLRYGEYQCPLTLIVGLASWNIDGAHRPNREEDPLDLMEPLPECTGWKSKTEIQELIDQIKGMQFRVGLQSSGLSRDIYEELGRFIATLKSMEPAK